jgi:hypothetical protein
LQAVVVVVVLSLVDPPTGETAPDRSASRGLPGSVGAGKEDGQDGEGKQNDDNEEEAVIRIFQHEA